MDITMPGNAEAYVAEWEAVPGRTKTASYLFHRTADEQSRFARNDESLGRTDSAAYRWHLVNVFACAELRMVARGEREAAEWEAKKLAIAAEEEAAMQKRVARLHRGA